jgi:squalene synthase HpnC
LLKSEKIFDELGKFSKHYENFPVASIFIPKDKKNIVRLIYWFARTADDFADEGCISIEKRFELLNEFEKEFIYSLNSNSKIEYLNLLANEIKGKKLDSNLFIQLLSAFKQDITKLRYSNFLEILDYCSRSANPIGRLLLQLFDYRFDEVYKLSDNICTSLQIINFIQDTKIDVIKNRLYYPIDELKEFNVSESDFFSHKMTLKLKNLIRFNVNRANNILQDGKKILKYLKGRFAVEIKWTILGGEEILRKIERVDYDVLNFRPTLSRYDFFKILNKSLFKV